MLNVLIKVSSETFLFFYYFIKTMTSDIYLLKLRKQIHSFKHFFDFFFIFLCHMYLQSLFTILKISAKIFYDYNNHSRLRLQYYNISNTKSWIEKVNTQTMINRLIYKKVFLNNNDLCKPWTPKSGPYCLKLIKI